MPHQYNNSANESNPPLFIIIFGANNELFYVNWTRWLHSTFSALHLWRRHPVVVIWHLSLGTFFLISDEFRGFSHVTFLSRYCPMHAHWCSSRLKATGTHRAKVCTEPQWWSLLCVCGTLEQRCMCFHFIFNPFLPFLSLFHFECV